MRIALSLLSVCCLVACVPAEDVCLEVPAAVSDLRRGGWDGNGRSLRGGGWDANGTEVGAALEGIVLRDAASGALVAAERGWVGAEGASEHALSATTASGTTVALSARLARIEADVPLYEVTVEGTPVCDGAAMFAPGRWTETGEHVVDGTVTLACEEGVITKCALWGYAPWAVGDAMHAACTRMARADYCGDGGSWTRDGTPIDVTDAEGIQPLAGGDEMTFEAGWDEHGAVCVHASRYDVVGTDGSSILPPCWDALPRCDDLVSALGAGALVADYALHETVPACH
jgi:hypothetical protein